VALPEHHLRVAQLLGGEPAAGLVRVVDDAVVQRQAQLPHGGVAAQVLVGHEQHPLAALERPLQRALGVGRRADRAAVPAGERLDGGAGVHVGDRHGAVRDAGLGQHVPALLDLVEGRHVGHRAAGGEVRQHDGLSGPVRMSADSAMKCTPQKTMNSASGRAAACWASLKSRR
jgi:hypothetical protein